MWSLLPLPQILLSTQMLNSAFLKHRKLDQSLWKVSLLNSHCIDPHTAKFRRTWIIDAGRKCPGGPETALVHYPVCPVSAVFSQLFGLCSVQLIWRGPNNTWGLKVQILIKAELATDVSSATNVCHIAASTAHKNATKTVDYVAVCISHFLALKSNWQLHWHVSLYP